MPRQTLMPRASIAPAVAGMIEVGVGTRAINDRCPPGREEIEFGIIAVVDVPHRRVGKSSRPRLGEANRPPLEAGDLSVEPGKGGPEPGEWPCLGCKPLGFGR